MDSSSPLKNPVVIGILVAAAVGVVFLNINTFSKKPKAERRVQAAVMDGPAVPPDLSLLVQQITAGNAAKQATVSGPVAQAATQLERDPFKTQQKPKPSTVSSVAAGKAPAPKKEGLACTAVMTGGTRASARINGRFYRQGERVEGYTVAWVASNGVTLKDRAGRKKFLPLNKNSENSRGKPSFQIKVGSAAHSN
jgi:hypothetical protein